MKIQVLYFQDVKRRTGIAGEEFELPEGANVAELAARIIEAHPQIKALSRSLLYAVNEEHAGGDQELAEGDTVALMPPFSGG